LAVISLNTLKEKLIKHENSSKDLWSSDFRDFLDIIIDLFVRNLKSNRSKSFSLLEIDVHATSQILKFVDQKDMFSQLLENLLFPLVEQICIYPSNWAECMDMVIELSKSTL
jgi:hypothetical protein